MSVTDTEQYTLQDHVPNTTDVILFIGDVPTDIRQDAVRSLSDQDIRPVTVQLPLDYIADWQHRFADRLTDSDENAENTPHEMLSEQDQLELAVHFDRLLREHTGVGCQDVTVVVITERDHTTLALQDPADQRFICCVDQLTVNGAKFVFPNLHQYNVIRGTGDCTYVDGVQY